VGPKETARSKPERLVRFEDPTIDIRPADLEGGGQGLSWSSRLSPSSNPLDDASSSRGERPLVTIAEVVLRPRAALAAANMEPLPPGPPLGAVFLFSRVDVIVELLLGAFNKGKLERPVADWP